MSEDEQFVEEALACVDAGNAGHWPTVAGYLANEVRRLRATPTVTSEQIAEAVETVRVRRLNRILTGRDPHTEDEAFVRQIARDLGLDA